MNNLFQNCRQPAVYAVLKAVITSAFGGFQCSKYGRRACLNVHGFQAEEICLATQTDFWIGHFFPL